MQLAHPLYGIMMLDFRPVDCISRQPLALVPGYISNTVYGDRVETGWAWFPYRQSAAQFWQGVRPCPWASEDFYRLWFMFPHPARQLALMA